MLDDVEYKRIISLTVKSSLEEISVFINPQITWEMIKIRVKECYIIYCI